MIKTTVKSSKLVFCTYLSHFSTVLDVFFFGSTHQIKHPIFMGQGAGQLSHTQGMTRAIAYTSISLKLEAPKQTRSSTNLALALAETG